MGQIHCPMELKTVQSIEKQTYKGGAQMQKGQTIQGGSWHRQWPEFKFIQLQQHQVGL